MEIDELLLIGEVDLIVKDVGDIVMLGSFVVFGVGVYCVIKVGSEVYVVKLVVEVSKFILVKFELCNGINRIL